MLEESKDNNKLSGKYSRKMRNITKHATPYDINNVIFIILELFTSLRITTKATHITQ